MQALMIGCGNMGGALLARWADSSATQFTVVDPAASFSHPRVSLHMAANTLPKIEFDLLIVAVKPQLIDEIIPGYKEWLSGTGAALSIAAGYSSARLSRCLDGKPVIRVMPNMPASVGRGMSGVFMTDGVSQAARQAALDLMSATGDVVEVASEEDLDKVTAVAGSGPGYVFEMARAYAEAAQGLGFDEATARKLVLTTLAGAVEMALQSDHDLAGLRNAVTSKAGTTEAGLNALNGNGDFSRLIDATVNAAYTRAIELR